MRTPTTIARGVLPVAVAATVLMVPVATLAGASEPALPDDTSLDGPVTEEVAPADDGEDDTSTTTVEATDDASDDATGTQDVDETLESGTDDGGDEVDEVETLLEDRSDDLLGETAEPIGDTVRVVEATVTGEEDAPPAEGEEPTEDGGAETEPEGSGGVAGDGDDRPEQEQEQAGQPSAATQGQRSTSAAGPVEQGRTPVPPPASQGERGEVYADPLAWLDEAAYQLAPRARVEPGPVEVPPLVVMGGDDPTYLPTAGSRSTAPIVEILQRTQALPSVVARVMAPFPVAGLASYSDDWGAPRHPDRVHRGVDVFAARGTPVIASMDGVITGLRHHQGLGGNWLRLQASDGTYLYYAHLEGFAPGIEQGVSVSRGQVLGGVGTSGNARGTPPHLHLQIHPAGGSAVPPVPYLDRWREQAYQAALAFESADGGVVLPQVAAPADATETSTAPDVPERGVSRTPTVGVEGTHSIDRGSASTVAPAAMGVLALVLMGWALLRRPARRKLAVPDTDDFLDRIEVAEPIRPQPQAVSITDR